MKTLFVSYRVTDLDRSLAKTSWLTDPDGYRIELVEWPSGHPDGITAADFA